MADNSQSLLPSNRSELERSVEQATGFAPSINIESLWDAQSCPEHLLPYLAWSVSVDKWNNAWPESVKRKVILSAIDVHRKKGTVSAVKSALTALGFGENSELVEGVEAQYYDGIHFAEGSQIYGGASWAKYHAKIDLGENEGIDADTAGLLNFEMRKAAPVRSHLTQIGFQATVNDAVESNEAAESRLYLSQSDQTPWLINHDGSHNHNQGQTVSFDGALTFDGLSVHYPSQRDGDSLLIQQQEFCTTHIEQSLYDQQNILRLFDGAMRYDGNAKTPVFAEDQVMPITLTLHHLHNGRKSYADGWNFHTGEILANAANSYANTANTYSGNVITQIQA